MEIEYRRITDLKNAPHNSRTHSREQVEQIAESMAEFGFTNPVLIDEYDEIIAGHGRREAAALRGIDTVPCVVLYGLTDAQKRAYVIADNQLPLNAGWDLDVLKAEVSALVDLDFNVDLLGFDSTFLDGLLNDAAPVQESAEIPEPPADPVTVRGDIWQLGPHRVMCGDSTSADDVERLMAGKKAALIHADPPYGMGKQADGVQNDNLYREKLDAFQTEWWTTCRLFSTDNASGYVWGNAPDLWRWWYSTGPAQSERVDFATEVVWDKQNAQGQTSAAFRRFPVATERCLFFHLGDMQYSTNADNHWDGWEPIREYLVAERVRAGVTVREIADALGVSARAPDHWFSRSQWELPPKNRYEQIQEIAGGAAFLRPWESLRSEWESLRSHFDNTHDAMTDVWRFPRVVGEERHGHATPKPVEMMARVMRSSLPKGGLCLEPFCGSGSTLIGAEQTGRRCYAMELTPAHVDVTVRRWQTLTGLKAVHAETGAEFDEHGG